MDRRQPVKITRDLATRLRQQTNRAYSLESREAGRKHLYWMIGQIELTSDWSADTTYRFHPVRAKGKIHSTNLSDTYAADDEIEVDIYAEKAMGENGDVIVAAYTGTWIALCSCESSTEVSEIHSYSDNFVHLPMSGFSQAHRDPLIPGFTYDSGQWFLSDGKRLVAPLPYVKRMMYEVQIPVAKDHGWAWERFQTEDVLKKPDGMTEMITDVALSKGEYVSTGGVAVVTDVTLSPTGSGSGSTGGVASTNSPTTTITPIVPASAKTVVKSVAATMGEAVTGVEFSNSSSSAGATGIVSNVWLESDPYSSTSGVSVLSPTDETFLNITYTDVMESPETLDFSITGTPAEGSVSLVSGMEVSDVTGSSWTSAGEVEFVSRVYCEDNEIVYETKKLRLVTGALSIVSGQKVQVPKTVTPTFVARNLSAAMETTELDVVLTRGNFVTNVVSTADSVPTYTSGEPVTVVTSLTAADTQDYGVQVEKSTLELTVDKSPIETVRCYKHDSGMNESTGGA